MQRKQGRIRHKAFGANDADASFMMFFLLIQLLLSLADFGDGGYNEPPETD